MFNKITDIMWNLVNMFLDRIDVIGSVSCLLASLGCAYLATVILRERTPLVDLQRWSLTILAIALFANSVYFYPDWVVAKAGRRPTGVIVDMVLCWNVIVMCLRGAIMYQPGRPRPPISSSISNQAQQARRNVSGQ
jgi:cytochrome bd-type quinol oxidase subunit 1